jgi:hypothetical protein
MWIHNSDTLHKHGHHQTLTDERGFLLKVFLPWVGLRKRLRVHRDRIADEFLKTAGYTAGISEEYAHLVNIYRNIVADLIDPYLTLPVACYQFVEDSFTHLEAANYGGTERNKDEYLRSRIRNDDPEVRLLSGYSPLSEVRFHIVERME